MVYLSLFCGVIYMLCIINYQYTHNQAKLCQNFQFFHIYITLTSFSVNMHHFPVEKQRISVEITEISPGIHRNFVFEFKSPFHSKIAKSAEISAEIPFAVIGEILRKNGNVNPGRNSRTGFSYLCRSWRTLPPRMPEMKLLLKFAPHVTNPQNWRWNTGSTWMNQ